MPARVSPLTDARIRNAKARNDGAPLKLADGQGLYLWVLPSGRYWRLKYRHDGREKLLALGVYPAVKAAEARKRADEARRVIRDKRDPSAERRAEKVERQTGKTFGEWADRWLESQRDSLAGITHSKATWILKGSDPEKPVAVVQRLRDRPIAEIEPAEVLELLEKLTAAGTYETAHRAKQYIGKVMRYAIGKRAAQRDPTADIRGLVPYGKVKHRAAVTDPAKVGELLRALDGYTGQPVTLAALRLSALLFPRPGELRAAEWAEFDLDGAEPEWRIPAGRMKMKEAHVVPLPRQAVAILRELRRLTGNGRYLFPSLRTKQRCMSENTINAALRRLGYDKAEMTGHGFRSTASTILNELGWNADAIERQLAHAPRNKVRAAYNRAQHLPERRRMMQGWADHLDGLRVKRSADA